MRIAQVAPRGVHPYSGLLASLVDLAIALRRRGLGVEVWQLHPWPEDNDGFTRRLEAGGVELVPEAGDDRRRGAGAAARNTRRPDVVHLHGVFNPTNNRVARSLDVPYVISPHGGYADGTLSHHRWRKIAFKHLRELPMLRRAAAVCALTEQEAAEIRRFGVAGSVPVIPNGTPALERDLDAAAFRRELGIAESTTLAVFAGRIDVRTKRLDEVVRSIAAAQGWHVAIVGGDFRDGVAELRRLAADLGVKERVHLPGPRRGRALHQALAAADVFVLLSRSEGMPMALLEALAAGTPAVVSPEVDAVLPVANAGWVTAPTGLAPLLKQLSHLSAAEWEHCARAARQLAARYDWDEVAEAYVDLYRNLGN